MKVFELANGMWAFVSEFPHGNGADNVFLSEEFIAIGYPNDNDECGNVKLYSLPKTTQIATTNLNRDQLKSCSDSSFIAYMYSLSLLVMLQRMKFLFDFITKAFCISSKRNVPI